MYFFIQLLFKRVKQESYGGRKKGDFKTIADDVGVSISVVSRVLRNKKKVVPITAATKKQVLESAVKHGLQTNRNIGIMIPDNIMNYDLVHYPFVAGVFSQANNYNFGVFSASFSENAARRISRSFWKVGMFWG